MFGLAGHPHNRFRIYGDPIYRLDTVVSGRYRHAAQQLHELAMVARANAARTSVEWGFGKVRIYYRQFQKEKIPWKFAWGVNFMQVLTHV